MAILNIIGNTSANIGGVVSASVPQLAPFIATGGQIRNFQSGSFVYTSHTFTSSGTFIIGDGQRFADVLLVGGGGGGRSGSLVGVGGEGGGAGGYILQKNVLFSTASIQIPYVTSSFVVTVGNGGAQNQSGSDSILSGSVTYDSKPPVLIAYGGGAGSGSGASGGGQGSSLYPTQGNDGGFRLPSTTPNNVISSSYYSAGAGGGFSGEGGAPQIGAHRYWNYFVSGTLHPPIVRVYMFTNFTTTSSVEGVGTKTTIFTAPPAAGTSGYPTPVCDENRSIPTSPYQSMFTNCSSQVCQFYPISGSAFGWDFGQPVTVNQAGYDTRTGGGFSGSVVVLQYRDSTTEDWKESFRGVAQSTADSWYAQDRLPSAGGVFPEPNTKICGQHTLISMSFSEGGNLSGAPTQATLNTLIDGSNNFYSAGGVGGAWSGATTGSITGSVTSFNTSFDYAPQPATSFISPISVYVQDTNGQVALNAGSGGYSGSLNGGNATANSGCGGGGGAVNSNASLRGTGGSGGSGIVVITYISGSAI